MSDGRSLAGPMPSLSELVRKSGISVPATVTLRALVTLGEISPIVGEPERSPSSSMALNRIHAVRDAFLKASDAIGEGMRARHVAMTYPTYLDTLKNVDKVERHIRERTYLPNHLSYPEILHFAEEVFSRDIHSPNFQGYVNYVTALHQTYGEALGHIPAIVLPDETRQQHTYITGSAGSGKTELLKALIAHDITQRTSAVVIIDPTGNLARAVAMWPEFWQEPERLAYINPKISPGHVPAMNPLDARHLSREERGILAGQLTDVLAQVVGKGEWTTQTETVANACFQILVNRPGATLRDLRLALVESETKKGPLPSMVADIIREGQKHHIAEIRDFFTYEFMSSQYATSKGSLRAKIGNMLRNELFANITGHASSIRLEELIAARKIIIFDLGAWGDNTAAGAFGRLVVAQIAAIGMRRAAHFGESFVPVHAYMDEADLFVSPAILNILSKLRQHGIHMTLAQQTAGYGFESREKQQLMNNTAIKFTAGDGQKEMLAMMHAPIDATWGLKQGQFVGRWGRDGEVFRLKVRSDLLGNTRRMDDEEWEEVLAGQLERFYVRQDAEPEERSTQDAPAHDTGGTWRE